MTFIIIVFLMIRLPPRSTRTDPLFPYTTLFRSRHMNLASVLNISAPAGATIQNANAVEGGLGFDALMETASTPVATAPMPSQAPRSEEHTSELQSLMRISYAVFCLNKKNQRILIAPNNIHINVRPE